MSQQPSGDQKPVPENSPNQDQHPQRYVIRALLVLMTVEWIYLLLNQRVLALFLVTLIILILLAPVLFKKKLDLIIPVEFHMVSVVFIFASLYLGEVQSFYHKLWWWDIILHTTAGLLMGMLGFLLVFILNESRRVDLHMTAGFIAFFAFTFAVTIGTVWEVFEFAMDQLFDLQMQKPMFRDHSGLTDTMWDIIVNAAGAFVVSLIGWRFLKKKQNFFLKKMIRQFFRFNPRMFKK